MSLLIFALIVVIVAGLLVWAVDIIPITGPLNAIVKVIVILFAVLAICNRAGFI